jgi:hypothetical protein
MTANVSESGKVQKKLPCIGLEPWASRPREHVSAKAVLAPKLNDFEIVELSAM